MPITLPTSKKKGTALVFPKPKIVAAPASDAIAKSNISLTSQVQGAGGNAPDNTKPGFLSRLFGPADVLGVGVRSLIHNVVDTKNPVDLMAEVGKAQRGERRVEGSDILGDLGVQNKWGKMLGGLAVDVVTDPVTWATFGYGALTKAAAKDALVVGAEHGFDIAKMVKAVDVAQAAGDTVRAEQLAKSASIIGKADLGSTAAEAMKALSGGQTIPEMGRALQYDLYHGVLKGAADELGKSGGVKLFGKTVLPVQGAMDAATKGVQSLIADKAPVIGKLFSVTEHTAGGVGPVTQQVEKAAMGTKAAFTNAADEAARGLRDSLYKTFPKGEGDQLLDEALIATEHVMPAEALAQRTALYDARNAVTDELGKVEKAIGALNVSGGKSVTSRDPVATYAKAFGELQTKADGFSREMESLTSQIADLYRQHIDPALVGDYLTKQGVAPDMVQKFVDDVLPKQQALLDSLSGAKRTAGIGENTWLGSALGQARPDLPLSTGYAPIRPQIVESADKTAIAQRAIDEAAAKSAPPISLLDEGAEAAGMNLTAESLGLSRNDKFLVDEAARKADIALGAAAGGQEPLSLLGKEPVVTDAAKLSLIGNKGGGTGARSGEQFQRMSPSIEAAITDKGIMPELNYAEAMSQKVRGDIVQLGQAQGQDTLVHALGKQVMGSKTEGEALEHAAEGNEIMKLTRHGVDQFWEVPAQVKNTWTTFDKAFTDDASIKAFGKFYDKSQGLLKKGMTQWNIGMYNARNDMWNGWMAWAHDLAPVQDPSLWVKAKAWVASPLKYGDETYTVGDETLKVSEWMERAIKSGGLEGQFLKSEAGRAADIGTRLQNPLQLFDKSAGRIANVVEDGDRLVAWLTAKSKGLTDGAAGSAVNQAMYNFSPEIYTAFESKFLSRVIPFYRWFRNNTPEMLNVLTHTPGKMTWMSHLAENAKATNPIDESIMPDYMKHMFAIPLPIKNSQGDTVIWRPNSPMEDLQNLNGEARQYLSSISPLLRTPLELLTNKDWFYNNPVSNYPGEVKRAPGYLERFNDLITAANISPLTMVWSRVKETTGMQDKTAKDGSQYLAMNSYAVKAMRDLIPWMGNVGKFVDDQQRSPYDRIAQTTGIKLISYQTEQFAEQAGYNQNTALQNEVKRLKAGGKLAPKKAGKPKKAKTLTLAVKKPKKPKKLSLAVRKPSIKK